MSALSQLYRLSRLSRVRTATVAAAFAALALTGGAAPAHASTAAAAAMTCLAGDTCVLDARTGAHTDYDRLVFDVSDGALPDLTATASTDGAYAGPKGDTRYPTIKGSSYLMLLVQPSQAYTYSTPSPQTVALPSLQGVQLIWSTEGQTEFALSLGSYSSYAISHLTAPNRLIVDIYH